MMRKICSALTMPSPVVVKSRKIMWPLCSPPRFKFSLHHFLDHVTVADFRAQNFSALRGQRFVETEIAHDRRDQSILAQLAGAE